MVSEDEGDEEEGDEDEGDDGAGAETVRFYGYCCESVAARQHPHYETPGAEQSAHELVIRVID